MGLQVGATVSEKKPVSKTLSARSSGGCNTCKAVKRCQTDYYNRLRRVKCDETKPGCTRCMKFGRVCDGYSTKKKSPQPEPYTRSGGRIRSLAPIAILAVGKTPLSCPPQVPITIVFDDESEERYFRIFHEETASALSGGFDNPLWNRIVLQACHDEPCILHCAVAISALDLACKVKNVGGPQASDAHHQYALQQYSKALKGVQDVVFNHPHKSLRTALIASLLIYCFENFHGDIRLALTNVRSAVDLVHNWLAENVGPTSAKGFSPQPYVVEDELVAAFARLDVHLMSWTDTAPVQRIPILFYAITEPWPIPSAFHSLADARVHFDNLANRAIKYLASIRDVENKVEESLHNQIFHAGGKSYEEPAIGGELRAWMKAFDYVLNNASEVDFVGANTLRIHALTLQTSLRSAFFSPASDDTQFDIFLPEYCEMVALARRISTHKTFIKSFTFDTGILPPLFIVVAKCRDDMLRREVIDVLKNASPRREGVWDALMVAKIGEELLRFESEDAQVKEREWVKIHLQCVNTTFALPTPEKDEVGEERLVTRVKGRNYLLDWVERTMKMDVVSEEPRYGRGNI